jgi:hypothetical protein
MTLVRRLRFLQFRERPGGFNTALETVQKKDANCFAAARKERRALVPLQSARGALI